MKETTLNILNSIFLFIIILFLLDALTSFQIKSQFLKSTVYIGLLFGGLFMMVSNFFIIRKRLKKVLLTTFAFMAFVGVIILNPMKILSSSSAWKTQIICYQSKVAEKRIEFQMQNIGAFGYKKRFAEVQYFTPFFMLVKEIDLNTIDTQVYKKVSIDVNELELKFP